MKKKLVNSKTVQRTTPEGILVDQEISKTYVIKLDDTDKFFMIYYNMLRGFYQIKYLKDVMLLIRLVEMADYNTGTVTIAAKTREDLCKELEVTRSNLSPMFKRLVDLELIFGEKGVYTINEGVFWKGDASIRRDILKERGLEFILKFTR
jgi:predicted transcriptional regulator